MSERYLLFAGDTYYARGGGNDYIGSESTYSIAASRAKTLLKTMRRVEHIQIAIDWSHVFDTKSGEVVEHFGTNPYGNSIDDATEDNNSNLTP